MRAWNPLNDAVLRAQIRSQLKHRWDIEKDIDWKTPVDTSRYLVPLDRDAVVFPGASAEQRLALSQLLGLLLNATIGEMEDAILKLRDVAWEQCLRVRPVNPEMLALGDLFFEEESKHSATFARYIDKFCESTGVPKDALDQILPKIFGSHLIKATQDNARKGGFAFWWIVAATEEVSVEVYRHLRAHEKSIEPLFYSIHRRHLEEEARHRNYAFLMLDLIYSQPGSITQKIRRKTDSLRAQALTTAWVLAEMTKVLEVGRLRNKHPFFEVITSCLPLFKTVSYAELLKKLFVSAPFISLVLNPRHHRLARKAASELGVLSFPFPEPNLAPVYVPDLPARRKKKVA